MLLKRIIQTEIEKRLFKGKAIIIYGPRRSGKTTLMKTLIQKLKKDYIWFSGDKLNDIDILIPKSDDYLKTLTQNAKIIAIDELQYFPQIGKTIKLFTDYLPDKQVIATGSSSIKILQRLDETLTGRKYEFYLFPFSFEELVINTDILTQQKLLEKHLIFGLYPEVITNPGDEIEILFELQSNYLYKDLFTWSGIKRTDKLLKLVKALAYQIGNIISLNELAKLIGLNIETVERYIELLEQTFIIFRLGSFSRNLRSELKKAKKIYFWDNGIRNAIINDFSPFHQRLDKGQLWENFVVSEFFKTNFYKRKFLSFYFWRTHQKQEIDLIITKDQNIFAFEIKLQEKRAKLPRTFSSAYPTTKFHIITPENFWTVFGNFFKLST